MKSGVYRIGLGNGWFYVGSSVNLVERERQHRLGMLRGRHRNPKMQAIWDKYGVFEFTVLELCPIAELLPKEQSLLDIHFCDPANANLCPIAGRVTHRQSYKRHKPVSDAHRKALSDASKLKAPVSLEARRKMSEGQKRRPPITDETRRKLSIAAKAQPRYPLSPATRKKISDAHKKLGPVSDATRTKRSLAMKAVWHNKRIYSDLALL